MKYQVMIDMLFLLLKRRKVNAGELAARYGISPRTVYRYIEEMTVSGIPIDLARGAGGGIYISDAYKLPRGFMTRGEYDKAIEAMQAMESELGDAELRSAIEKLSAQRKRESRDDALSGNLLVDSGAWGSDRTFSEKLRLLSRATDEREALEIDYTARDGRRTRRVILPHLLVCKQNLWYVYAFCRLREEFRLFKVGRIRSMIGTGETFERLPFSRADVPLSFWTDGEKCVEAKFSIAPDVFQGYWDEDGMLTIMSKTHDLYGCRNELAPAIGMDPEKVRMIDNPAGGCFGYSTISSVFAIAGVAVMALDMPVSMTLSYEEHMHMTGKRSATYSNGRLACDEDGKIQAVEFDVAMDHGAYAAKGEDGDQNLPRIVHEKNAPRGGSAAAPRDWRRGLAWCEDACCGTPGAGVG